MTASRTHSESLKTRIADLERAVDRQDTIIQRLENLLGQTKGIPSHPAPTGISRATLLRTAGIGLVGAASATVLSINSSGTALADGSEGQTAFSSETSTPTVTVNQSGTGAAVSATSSSVDAATIAAISSATGTDGVAVQGMQNDAGTGVSGTSSTGMGVLGTSGAGTAITGHAASGTGVLGTTDSVAPSAVAIQGTITSTAPGANSVAVSGSNAGTAANGIGVLGSQAGSGVGVSGYASHGTGVLGKSASGIGVHGITSSRAASAVALQGNISSTSPGKNSAAVAGVNAGSDSTGTGVLGTQAGKGTGVTGIAPAGFGVFGIAKSGVGVGGASVSGEAIVGVTTSKSTNVNAIEGDILSSSPGKYSAGVAGFNAGGDSTGYGVFGSQNGSGSGVGGYVKHGVGASGVTGDGFGVEGVAGAKGAGVFGAAPSGGYAVYAHGHFVATGKKSAAVLYADGKRRAFYCLESPECWFEDFGSATLRKGSAHVKLDPKFAAAVDTSSYFVFLTPMGNSNGLYVGEINPSGFTILEQSNGKNGVKFSYRVVALRADVDAPRLQVLRDPLLMDAPSRVAGLRQRAQSRRRSSEKQRRLLEESTRKNDGVMR
jgi:hypothetical protein